MNTLARPFALCAIVLLAACGDAGEGPDAPEGNVEAPAAAEPSDAWPMAAPFAMRRVRDIDLTGDGTDERLIATVQGMDYDSLDIAVTIESATGDTLWYETWNSRLYFVYDGLEGKADSTVQRIVREHVDRLLQDDRFAMSGGLPEPLRQGTGMDDMKREALRYSLAELDYRRNWDLLQSDAIPPEAYSDIADESIEDERVEAVLQDVADSPTFMYFAGGEATYAIAWSERENAFVRLHSCC